MPVAAIRLLIGQCSFRIYSPVCKGGCAQAQPMKQMSTPFIEMKDVAFAYGERPILSNINFHVEQGRFAAIMGGSGSGKTTLLRLITGQIHPQQG